MNYYQPLKAKGVSESESEYNKRMQSEKINRIAYLTKCIEENSELKTADWGSGTFKKRKNKAYSKNNNSRLSAWQSELQTLKLWVDQQKKTSEN